MYQMEEMWAKGGMTKWGTEDHHSCPEGQPDLTP